MDKRTRPEDTESFSGFSISRFFSVSVNTPLSLSGFVTIKTRLRHFYSSRTVAAAIPFSRLVLFNTLYRLFRAIAGSVFCIYTSSPTTRAFHTVFIAMIRWLRLLELQEETYGGVKMEDLTCSFLWT